MDDGTQVRQCQVCTSTVLMPIFDMGSQPLAERYNEDLRYPLTLLQCQHCMLVQLSYIPPQGNVFPLDHPYSTGNSRQLREHFALMACDFGVTVEKGDLVVDIGANDGTFLTAMAEHTDATLLAVEPTNQIDRCAMNPRLHVWQDFFTLEVAKEIRQTHGAASLIVATNVLAHVPDPHDFLAGVRELLSEDGQFVTENHALSSVTEGLQIDTIYHEHLRYYSPQSLSYLLGLHDFNVQSIEPVETHGGSFRTTAAKNTPDFPWRAQRAAQALHDMAERLVAEGAVIYGVGAATRATPLLHYAGLAPFITKVCEVSTSDKIGKLMPGTQIPIVDDAALTADKPDFALLFSWHLMPGIASKLHAAGYKGTFILPLPWPELFRIG